MTREEFKKIVNKFNSDKIKNNWISLLDIGPNCGWKKYKAKIINYPDYYEFSNAQEFRFWLTNSEDRDFIDNRFCPICGKFIENKTSKPYIYPSGCSKECIIKIKDLHRKENLIKKTTRLKNILKENNVQDNISISDKKKYSHDLILTDFIVSEIKTKKDMLKLIEDAYPDVIFKKKTIDYPFKSTAYFPFTMSNKEHTPKQGIYYDFYENENKIDIFKEEIRKKNNLKGYTIIGLDTFKEKWDRSTLNYDGNDETLNKVWKIFYKEELLWWKNPENRVRLYNNKYITAGKTFLDLTNAEILKSISTVAKIIPHRTKFERNKKIMKQFITKADIIYDPFGGWSERLNCAKEIGCEYYYNDINPELASLFKGTCENGFTYKPKLKEYTVFSYPPYILRNIKKQNLKNSFDWDTFFKIHKKHKIILILSEHLEKDIPTYNEKIPLNQGNKKSIEFVYIWYPKI